LYNNLDSCGDIHCALGQLKKEEIEGVLQTPLRILQMRRAFIAAFTSRKQWMTIKKVYSAIGHRYRIFHGAIVNPCSM
jgi:hypothetical protein